MELPLSSSGASVGAKQAPRLPPRARLAKERPGSLTFKAPVGHAFRACYPSKKSDFFLSVYIVNIVLAEFGRSARRGTTLGKDFPRALPVLAQ